MFKAFLPTKTYTNEKQILLYDKSYGIIFILIMIVNHNKSLISLDYLIYAVKPERSEARVKASIQTG